MKRSYELLEKRRKYVRKYVLDHQDDKQMKLIVSELSKQLFLSERTIYKIIGQDSFCIGTA